MLLFDVFIFLYLWFVPSVSDKISLSVNMSILSLVCLAVLSLFVLVCLHMSLMLSLYAFLSFREADLCCNKFVLYTICMM